MIMKNCFLFIVCIFLTVNLFSQTKNVLFLGNSYSYYNDGIPVMLSNVAESLGDTLIYDNNLIGGSTLSDHSVNAESLSKIASQNWDYVVLQDQSQLPSFPPSQVEVEVFPYAKILCDSIFSNDSCTIPMFFMTWGRENGDSDNCESYPPLCTYEGMQIRLRESYLQMAIDNTASVAPVGMVWKALREDFPSINLYSSDSSHPSMNGTYLATCVFYSSIFQKSPIGAYIPDDIDVGEASTIQEYANNVVFDSLDVWQIDTSNVKAHFELNFPVKSSYVSFWNDSENADYCVFDFGDGQISECLDSDNEVSHTYAESGVYNVCLTALKNCESDIYCLDVDTDNFIDNVDVDLEQEYFKYNSKETSLNFSSVYSGKRVWIYDALGRLIDTSLLKNGKLSLSKYSGLILIKVQDTDIETLKVIL
jgi:hypothetical protein